MSSDSDDDVLGNLPGTDRPSAGGRGRGAGGGRVLRNFVAESNLSSSSDDDDGIVLPGTGGRGSGGGATKKALPSMGGGGGAKAPGPKTAAKRSPAGGATSGPTRAAPNPSPKKSAASSPTQQQGPKVIAVVTPIHPYTPAAGAENQISLQMGDVVNVFEKDASGWWVGRNTTSGGTGLFPSTYVEESGAPPNNKPAVVSPAAAASDSDDNDDDDDGSASFEDVGTADRTAERTPKHSALKASNQFAASTAPSTAAPTKSESPGQALNITPTSTTVTASPSQPQGGAKRPSTTAQEDDSTSDVSLNLDESSTMSPEQSRRAESLGSSLATPNPTAATSATKASTQEKQLAKAASSSPAARAAATTETSIADGEKTRSFRSQVGKTTIDSSPRQTVSDIKKRFSDDDTTSDISIPASRGPQASSKNTTTKNSAPNIATRTTAADVSSTVKVEQAEQQQEPKPTAAEVPASNSVPAAVEAAPPAAANSAAAQQIDQQPQQLISQPPQEDERDRDPELDNILPRNNNVSSSANRPPPVEGGQMKNPYYNYGGGGPGDGTNTSTNTGAAAIRSATPDRNRIYGSSPSPSDPGNRVMHPLSAAPSPNSRPPMSQQQTAPPGVSAVADRGRRELLIRAHERLNRRDSGTTHLDGGRAPSPGIMMADPQQRMTSGAADQAARDRLAKENARLTEELNFLQKDNQRLRQGMTEANSSEAQRLRSQLEESEATRKEHELTIARLKLQFEAQLKDASDHERALKDELRAYSTTLEQFETVCADKDQQLNQERATTTKLKQDLKEKEAECIRSNDEAVRIREDAKVRLERTNELLEDAKKQRTHLIELNDKFGRDKESAVAERKRLAEELKATQLELARQQERAADDAAASRRECDRYKALVQEKERVLGMRIADEQRAKEHYQAKVNEVEEQVTQIKAHQQEVLRTVQEEHRRQVSSVRDEIAHYQQRYREAQSEAESHQKRYEERMDIERKQLADEMNKTYATMEKDLQESRAANNRDEEVITGLRQRVAELEVEVDQLETTMLSKDEKLAAQEAELKTVTETLEHLLQSDDHVAKERDEMVAELDKARVEIANMRDDVAMCRTLDDQLQDLSRECERLSDELSRVSKDRSSLWTENHRLEGEVAQWRSEAQELRAAMKGRGISARVSSGGGHDFTY